MLNLRIFIGKQRITSITNILLEILTKMFYFMYYKTEDDKNYKMVKIFFEIRKNPLAIPLLLCYIMHVPYCG